MARPALRCSALLLGVLAALSAGCKKEEAPPPPPPTVEVTTVVQKDVPIFQEWIGSLDGFVNAEIRPQIEGYVLKRNYNEGFLVHAGDTLFEIDPRQFQASLRPGQGRPRAERGHPRQREDDGGTLQASGRTESHQPAGIGRRRDARAHGAGQHGVRSRDPREGEARPRLDEGHSRPSTASPASRSRRSATSSTA